MKSDELCIFCKIVAKEIPCATVYESDAFIAFLDIAPVNHGHTLLLPKAHYATILDMPESLGAELLSITKRLTTAILEATGASGLNVIQNNFATAGQEVDHIHFHLIPRHAEDGLRLWPQSEYNAMTEMNALAKKIASYT